MGVLHGRVVCASAGHIDRSGSHTHEQHRLSLITFVRAAVSQHTVVVVASPSHAVASLLWSKQTAHIPAISHPLRRDRSGARSLAPSLLPRGLYELKKKTAINCAGCDLFCFYGGSITTAVNAKSTNCGFISGSSATKNIMS